MTTHFTTFAQRAAADGKVSADELLKLRQEGWGDGIITREEAEMIFAINNALAERNDAWSDFFVEAIGAYVLNGTQPRLQCSREEARWLIDQIDHDGRIESFAELEALVRIVERAENVPDLLKDYLLENIEREVMTGVGPTRHGGELSDLHVSEAEVRVLRRVIFSSGGYGPAAVSRYDAELLFRLKDATLADANAPEWGDLFVDGIMNYLRGFAHDNAQLSHERKLELVNFIADTENGTTSVIREVANRKVGFGERINWAIDLLQGKVGPQNDYFAQAAAGDMVTDSEQDWLSARLEQDGQLDPLERRLLKRLVEDG